MGASFEIKDHVIVRRFSGAPTLEVMIDSWNELLDKYDNFAEFNGIITTFEGPPSDSDPGSVKAMVKLMNEHKERLSGLRIAIVLDHPMVTNAVMVDHYVKHIQVKPFVSEEAAMRWISP
jgi:hypothetical protein